MLTVADSCVVLKLCKAVSPSEAAEERRRRV